MVKSFFLAALGTIGLLAGADAARACSIPANICVHLPADARLFVDGNITMSTGVARYFATPPIADGQEFAYMLRCERVVNGKLVAETRSIKVRADDVTVVHFGDAPVERPVAATASVSSVIEVRTRSVDIARGARIILAPRATEVILSTKAPLETRIDVRRPSIPSTGELRVRVRQREGIVAPRAVRVDARISR